MSAEQRPDQPPRPATDPTLAEFAGALKQLRVWAGLRLDDLPALSSSLKVSTSSDYERGLRSPRWEWLHAFVTVCLAHPKRPRQPLTAVDIRSELERWQSAWTHVNQHPAQKPEPTNDRDAPGNAESVDRVSLADTAGSAEPHEAGVEESASTKRGQPLRATVTHTPPKHHPLPHAGIAPGPVLGGYLAEPQPSQS